MEEKKYPGKEYQELFDHINTQHDITLHESEMNDIIELVRKLDGRSGTAAGREEDGLTLLMWLNKNEWGAVGNGEYINHSTGRIIKEEKLYQEFKQQKEK